MQQAGFHLDGCIRANELSDGFMMAIFGLHLRMNGKIVTKTSLSTKRTASPEYFQLRDAVLVIMKYIYVLLVRNHFESIDF